ncbi:uncharacterized protein MEPE_05015 [Melanopsichium pennsylvanicum]|uniref:Uncharacterized protein n=1 Tax=Melanopsichium pennsylvanicum TaxID=63383 RepID=A0AAJ4XQY8_9BASI|nr:uncharacterized protein MEPE_05015 [Melanopsichium pennsylvanicum]
MRVQACRKKDNRQTYAFVRLTANAFHFCRSVTETLHRFRITTRKDNVSYPSCSAHSHDRHAKPSLELACDPNHFRAYTSPPCPFSQARASSLASERLGPLSA